MQNRRIITRDGRKEVYQGNRMIAFVDPDTDILWTVNRNGYMTYNLGEISQERQILPRLDKHALQP